MVILQRDVKMSRKVRQYTRGFKEEAVRLAPKLLSVVNVNLTQEIKLYLFH